MNTRKLKPCPFCGGHSRFCGNGGGEFVECETCHASSAMMFPEKCDVKPLLIERWNERISNTPAALKATQTWLVTYHDTARVWYVDVVGHPFQFAMRPTSDCAGRDEMDAIARLVGVAPELLQELREARKELLVAKNLLSDVNNDVIKRIDAVIAKVEA